MNFISITGGSDCNVRNENFAMKLEKLFHEWQELKISRELTFLCRIQLMCSAWETFANWFEIREIRKSFSD